MQTKKVDIIVPVWANDTKTAEMTFTAIDSLETTEYDSFELIIVDDCSPYPMIDELRKRYGDRHTVLQTPKNGGSTAAFNFGFEHSTADFVQYQNNDIVITNPNWLRYAMIEFDHDDVGVVGCLLRFPDGRIQHAGACWRNKQSREIVHIGYMEIKIKPLHDVPFVTGCGMIVRREILTKNNGLTTFEGYGWDDIDIQVKAKADGWRIRLAFDAQFIHMQTQTYKFRKDLCNSENYQKNQKAFEHLDISNANTIKYFVDRYYLLK